MTGAAAGRGGAGAAEPGAGLDSLSGVMLLREVHERFGVDVAAEDLNFDALATLGTLAAFIEARTAQRVKGGG